MTCLICKQNGWVLYTFHTLNHRHSERNEESSLIVTLPWILRHAQNDCPATRMDIGLQARCLECLNHEITAFILQLACKSLV